MWRYTPNIDVFMCVLYSMIEYSPLDQILKAMSRNVIFLEPYMIFVNFSLLARIKEFEKHLGWRHFGYNCSHNSVAVRRDKVGFFWKICINLSLDITLMTTIFMNE